MRSRMIRVGLAVAAVLTVALSGCGAGPAGGHDMGSMPSSGAPASGASTTASPAAGAHNDADVMFATMMIPHHAQAVQMSDIFSGKSDVDPGVTTLAAKIKKAQGPEITTMSGWLAGWGQNPSPSAGGMDHGDMGMMSQADLEALTKADGAEAGSLFLTGMIKHHEGAVAMARTELQDGENGDAKSMAQRIVTSQQAEITEMKKLLGG